MILFAADNHYGAHPGRVLYDCLRDDFSLAFFEDDWQCFEVADLRSRYQLVMLNMIAGTCDVPPPAAAAALGLLGYLRAGGSLLLLHGASAAFWPEPWWRAIVGLRWVRGNDPDGVAASTHPKRPYPLRLAKSRHPLCQQLQPLDLPEDEIYINLEQTCPVHVLLETTTDEGTFPQAYEARTPWGGRILAYLPGHRPEVVAAPGSVANVRALLTDLL